MNATIEVRSFQTRAELYAHYDARLARKTRFFGAACLTNRILACLASHRSGLVCSATTCSWLYRVGGVLETRNIHLAEEVAHRAQAGNAVDQYIVSAEQSLLEEVLHNPRLAERGIHAAAIAEMNAILNFRYRAALISPRTEVRCYARVLAAVRAHLTGPLDFGRQEPRNDWYGIDQCIAARQARTLAHQPPR